MSIASKSSKLSGHLFTLGFIIGKIKYLPIPILIPSLNLLSMIIYGLGYASWILACYLCPHHPKKRGEWYGFAPVKDQSLYAAVVGLLATILSASALVAESLLCPAAWLFVGANLLWAIGEYHKLKNPPLYEKDFCSDAQKAYVRYAFLTTCVSFITALGLTLPLLLPASSTLILTVSSVLCVSLSVFSLGFFLQCTYKNHNKCSISNQDIELAMTTPLANLRASPANTPNTSTNDLPREPSCYPFLFTTSPRVSNGVPSSPSPCRSA